MLKPSEWLESNIIHDATSISIWEMSNPPPPPSVQGAWSVPPEQRPVGESVNWRVSRCCHFRLCMKCGWHMLLQCILIYVLAGLCNFHFCVFAQEKTPFRHTCCVAIHSQIVRRLIHPGKCNFTSHLGHIFLFGTATCVSVIGDQVQPSYHCPSSDSKPWPHTGAMS